MVELKEVKAKILNFIARNGPSLPIQIAKEMNMNSIFVSAFLSELVDDKKIKMSYLKVGGTHLYMLDNQEQQLEKFHMYLHPKEIEAFQLLKERKILADNEEDPAIRVALRSIKDFAIGFKINEEIFWKYVLVPDEEAINLLNRPKNIIQEKEIPVEIKLKLEPEIQVEKPIENRPLESTEPQKNKVLEHKERSKHEKKNLPKEKIQTKFDFENPLAIHNIEKPSKEKPKSDFALEVIKFLEKNNLEILEEKEHKAKEYLCIAEMQTELGPIAFLTQAKEKKSVTDTDLNTLLRQAQTMPLPALFLTTGNLTKKALEYQQKYYSILKTKKIT